MDPALEKLRAAVEEYLAAGGDTPVAPEAQALMDAIDQGGQGGQPPMGLGDMAADPMAGPDAGPQDAGLDAGGMDPNDPNAPNAYPAAGGDQGQIPTDTAMPPPQNAKTFEGARAGAKDRLKKLNKR